MAQTGQRCGHDGKARQRALGHIDLDGTAGQRLERFNRFKPGGQKHVYVIAETDEKALQALAQYPREAVFPLKAEVGAALLELDQRNVAGEGRRPAHVNRVLPINFCGGPDEIAAQLKQAREQIGAGVVDLSFQTPGSDHPDALMEALELFGKNVLPHIRNI